MSHAEHPPLRAGPTWLERHQFTLIGCLTLAAITFLLYLPSLDHGFVNYDDDIHVEMNQRIAGGLTREGVKWAFGFGGPGSVFGVEGQDYWGPVRWLSHMADIELYGIAPRGHHLTNVVIHCAAAVVLLLAWLRMTGSFWPSFVVAALFAWHPLHVESVAWIAERKDVLCGFFWFVTLWLYARYVRAPGWKTYLLVLASFLLGLMSKPMIVTLPFALLLLDIWPLRRWRWHAGEVTAADHGFPVVSPGRLLVEKIPLFALAAGIVALTVHAQLEAEALKAVNQGSLAARLANAATAYVRYVGKTVYPVDLAVLYPWTVVSLREWMPALLGLVAASAGAAWTIRRLPFLFVGWFWFLGTLVPVIGLVQVGPQAMADRYTYIPLTGLFVCLVWGGARILAERPRSACVFAVGGLAACLVLTRAQLSHWQDSVALFSHTVRVTKQNVFAVNNLATALMAQGRAGEALRELEAALAYAPNSAGIHLNRGAALRNLDRQEDARQAYAVGFKLDPTGFLARQALRDLQETVGKNPRDAHARLLLAAGLMELGHREESLRLMAEALAISPGLVPPRVDLAAYLLALGKTDDAVTHLREALARSPDHELAHHNLGTALMRQERLPEAIEHFRAVLRKNPQNVSALHNLALALLRGGDVAGAKAAWHQALRLNPDHFAAAQQLAWIYATRREHRDVGQAAALVESALKNARATPRLLDTKAAVLALQGNFMAAEQTARQAAELARQAKAGSLAEEIELRRALYAAGQVFDATTTNALPPRP